MRGLKVGAIAKNFNNLKLLLEKFEEKEIGHFTLTRECYLSPNINLNRLDMLWLNVTSNCNYKCLHCYENASTCTINQRVMSLDEYKEFLDAITLKFKINCIQITGGEPLLRGKEFIFSLIKLIKLYDINTIEVFTNLSLVDSEYLGMFKMFGVQVATSFYSQVKERHDSITGVLGSYENSVEMIHKIREECIPIRIGVVMLRQNEDEAYSLRGWLNKTFGLNEKKMFDVVRPMGRGMNSEIVPAELFSERFINASGLRNYDFSRYFYNKKFNACWGNKLCLKSDGELYPCVMSSIKLGNYKDVIKVLSNKNHTDF